MSHNDLDPRWSAVERWMLRVVESGRLSAWDDLHVDQIDLAYSERGGWAAGAIACVQLAVAVATTHGLQVSVAAAFSLESSPSPKGLTFHDLAGAEHEMDWSPPSIYVFARGCEPWETEQGCVRFDQFEVGSETPMAGYLCEWFDENDADYRRSLWIVPTTRTTT